MAREFNGSTQYLSRNDAVIGAVPLTMACWAKLDDDANSQALIAIGRSDAADHYFILNANGNIAGDPIRALTRGGAGLRAAATSTGYTAGTWHHCAAVFAAVNSRAAYIDGGSKGTDSVSATPASLDRTAVGALVRSGVANHVDGQIAWPAIWNVALSDEEIVSLAAGIHPDFIRSDARVNFWPVGGFDGEYDRDLWGGKDLTASGSPTWTDHPPGLVYPSSAIAVPAVVAPAVGNPWYYYDQQEAAA